MSRAPGGFGINDIRSTSIYLEHTFKTYPCAPGAEKQSKCRDGFNLDCGIPPCGFDRTKDYLPVGAAFIIIATVIGLLNSFSLFIDGAQKNYDDMGWVECNVIAALTYLVLIKTSCLSNLLIQWLGHRITAMFGMLLIFVGLMLDSQHIHFAVFYVSHILFFGVGGGLAYTSAMAIPGEFFRDKLFIGMIIVCIAGSFGTIFYWLSIEYLIERFSYKWTKLTIAVLVLILTGITNVFPSFKINEGCLLASRDKLTRNGEIKNCIEQAARREQNNLPTQDGEEKACLCVCVCDISLWSDWSFLLWALSVLLATMALYLPYIYIMTYADSIGVEKSHWYITALCLTSLGSRIIFLIGNDFTFFYNRLLIQGGVFMSGILWILLTRAETFGWILVWCAAMGIVEGIIVCIFPRFTLLTIPKIWLQHSWGWILWFHAFGVAIATTFVGVIYKEDLSFESGFVTIGVLQIICGCIAFLLPNEEMCEDSENTSTLETRVETNTVISKNRSSYSYTGSGPVGPKYFTGSTNFMNKTTTSSFGNTNYKCNCPICAECSGCVPGGLLSSGGMDPCNPTLDTSSFASNVQPTSKLQASTSNFPKITNSVKSTTVMSPKKTLNLNVLPDLT